MYKIAVFAGDGIGPEVTREALKVLRKAGEVFHLVFEFKEGLLGGASIDRYGVPMHDEARQLAQSADAVFLGAVGGPKWDHLEAPKRPEKALLELRKMLGAFANLRPVKLFKGLEDNSTLKREVVRGLDFLILRELTGGIYFGSPRGIETLPDGSEKGFNTEVYTTPEIERIAIKAFEFARKRNRRVTSVDKANVLESSQLWRRVVTRVHQNFQDVALDHRYVDDCAMQLVRNPSQFDVIVTTNMFGDILSDEAAMLTGSIGMLASASIGAHTGLYEPVHGSAPDIAGKGLANPLAAILSAAMMLEFSFNLGEVARAIERAVEETLAAGLRTADLYVEGTRKVNTTEMSDAVVKALRS
ncbi:MAG: 3-isopropylmalate dehydrogenase [Omnitrophica bacterium GWA2_52_12]|nr:MAG: 3-isopropylmalate dehydrogenase [Omnitrophica bacterium GWA2_52_12]